MDQIEVMRNALAALEKAECGDTTKSFLREMEGLRQAIEQAEKQEPVGTVVEDDDDFGRVKALLDQNARVQLVVGAALYAHPPTAPRSFAEAHPAPLNERVGMASRLRELRTHFLDPAIKRELEKAADMLSAAQTAPAQQPLTEPSPTAGMNIAQRILHVGGRNNAAGYVEFGSIQAVEALVRQVLRDLPTSRQLADHEIVTMYAECPTCDADMIEFARAIEAHIKGEPK